MNTIVSTNLNESPKPVWAEYASGIAGGTVLLFAVIATGYAGLFAALYAEAISMPLAVLASTLLLYLSFTVAHEAGHGNIAHEIAWMKPVERFMGWMAVVPFLIVPFALFARIHDYHHAFTNDPEKDPDFWVSGRAGLRVVPHALLIPLVYLKLSFSRFAKDPVFARTHASSLLYYSFTFALTAFLVFAGYGEELLLVGVVPLFLASFVLAMLFDWIPHMPARQQGRWKNTRTYLFPGLKFLTLGQNYHHIHHLYPRVSWYHYDKVFDAVRPELEEKEAPIEELFSNTNPGLFQSPFARRAANRDSFNNLTLSVASVRKETADAVAIAFENLEGEPLRFKAGQYVTITARVGGETATRCYSIFESPLSGEIAVGVKRVQNGVLSTYLNDELKAGDKLSVAGPFGDFIYEPSRNGKSSGPLVLIAGGSGITPVLSILQTALASDASTRVHLIYANRSAEDAMFAGRLNALASAHGQRLKVTNIFEQPPAGRRGETGFIDKKKLARLLTRERRSTGARYYICGPGPMKDVVLAALKDFKIRKNRIFVEEFAQAAPAAKGPRHRVNIALADGARHELEVAENQTVLQAARAKGIKLPHACGVGQCGCCMMRLVEGDCESASPESPGLLPGEKTRGLTLACQARPKSPLTLREGRDGL